MCKILKINYLASKFQKKTPQYFINFFAQILKKLYVAMWLCVSKKSYIIYVLT